MEVREKMSMAKFSVDRQEPAKRPTAPKPAKLAKTAGAVWIDVGLGKVMAKQTPN